MRCFASKTLQNDEYIWRESQKHTYFHFGTKKPALNDSTYLASLYKYFSESLRVVGGPETLSPQFHEGIIEATKHQLHSLADKWKARAARANNPAFAAEVDKDRMALVLEIEDFALEDMAKMLTTFNVNHQLLVAVASVRDLGFNTHDSDEEGDD
jgi:importin-5